VPVLRRAFGQNLIFSRFSRNPHCEAWVERLFTVLDSNDIVLTLYRIAPAQRDATGRENEPARRAREPDGCF
jgi:hypothetical protein